MERAAPITGQPPCALLHWTAGTSREENRSDSSCWETAQKRLLSSFLLPFYSSTLLSSCSLPLGPGRLRSQAAPPTWGHVCFERTGRFQAWRLYRGRRVQTVLETKNNIQRRNYGDRGALFCFFSSCLLFIERREKNSGTSYFSCFICWTITICSCSLLIQFLVFNK